MTNLAKLVILDLNGTLVFRSKSNGSAFRRPYLQSFVNYLFHPSVATANSSAVPGPPISPGPLQIMVWSSAQPQNVGKMVQKAFGTKAGSLIAVWDRTHCGLTEAQYHRKSPTTKDLAKPWKSLAGPHSSKTTVLIDDSVDKAVFQPNNHICVIEYTKQCQLRDLRFMEGGTEEPPYDEMILALVGVLEEMRLQIDVAEWLRQGGLRQMASNRTQDEVDTDLVGRFAEMTTEDTSLPWFENGQVLKFWVTRGRQTLGHLGIPIRAFN
ncbi:hypothetical protein FRC18_011267 [Serendipita sp. 400]|nr:hypothetical protein FRC18_011267 [Serendipita sp. 400]